MAVEAVGVSARQLTSAVRIHFVTGIARRARVGGGAGVTVGVVTGQFARAVIQRVTGIARRARVGVCALFTVRVLGLTGVGSIQMIWDAIVIIVVRRISEHLLFAGVLWSFYLLFVFGHEEGNKKQQVEEMRRKH